MSQLYSLSKPIEMICKLWFWTMQINYVISSMEYMLVQLRRSSKHSFHRLTVHSVEVRRPPSPLKQCEPSTAFMPWTTGEFTSVSQRPKTLAPWPPTPPTCTFASVTEIQTPWPAGSWPRLAHKPAMPCTTSIPNPPQDDNPFTLQLSLYPGFQHIRT